MKRAPGAIGGSAVVGTGVKQNANCLGGTDAGKVRRTEETECPAHEWVEIAAVSRGNRLLRMVKLFGRVLDQEQHRLCCCDLLGAKSRQNLTDALALAPLGHRGKS